MITIPVSAVDTLAYLHRGLGTRVATRAALTIRTLPAYCPVCGRYGPVWVRSRNLRESATCAWCRSISRQRQLASVVLDGWRPRRRARSLRGLARNASLRVFNAESRGPVHRALAPMAGYRSSEYFGPDLAPGTVVGGVEHRDLQDIGFDDGAFDLVLTSDVLEHVSDPYAAHAEIRRVLRPGGRHVFTIPFHANLPFDRTRAELGSDGAIIHHFPAEYHGDPLSTDGALVFTDFGRGTVRRIADLGYVVTVHVVRAPWLGVYDVAPLVFSAVRADT